MSPNSASSGTPQKHEDLRMMAPPELIRLKQVLEILPLSKSTWWDGIKKGIYPKPIKLSPRVSCWRLDEITELASKGVSIDRSNVED